MERCDICPNNCLSDKSICGRSLDLNENIVETTAVAIDPIEKKPLYHYKPGSETLSIGTLGCNLKCLNCQNHSIAQPADPSRVPIRCLSPESIVELALTRNLDSISWTYNEPTIYPEWIIKTSEIAQEHDIDTILVTNGYTSQKTLDNLVNFVDAVNVDLKSMSNTFYHEICKGDLEVVKNSIEFYYNKGIHTEVTTLLIPGYNDSVESVNDVCDFIRGVSSDIVLHFSAFYPQFKLMHLPRTKDDTVLNACKIALESGLNYVYPGNIHSCYQDNSYCKKCGETLIERDYYDVKNYISENNSCPHCGSVFPVIL